MIRGKLVERGTELGYLAGWRLVRAMPKPLAWAAFRAGADRSARRMGPGAQRLSANLRRVVGPDVPDEELAELVRAGMRSYARYWLEAFRLPSLSRDEIRDGFRFDNGHLLGAAVAAGTGCVVALGHCGNWDFAGAWVCANGWPITTVAERLRPEGVYRRFLAYRESLGMKIVPATGGDRPPLDVLVESIGQAHIVPLLADRDLSARGVQVQFFGGKTRMPPGPALLTLRTGAPLFVVSLWYEGDLPCARADGPVAVPTEGSLDQRTRELTQTIADHLAAGIAEHPTDWHMLQRLWLDNASGATRVPGAQTRKPPSARAQPAG